MPRAGECVLAYRADEVLEAGGGSVVEPGQLF
jgi:hypothetical protein